MGDHSCGAPTTRAGKLTRRVSPGRRFETRTALFVTSPEGDFSCRNRTGFWTLLVRLTTQPSLRTIAAHVVAPGLHETSDMTPTSLYITRPCGISVTGRTRPPQFHQPSRSSFGRR